MQVGKGVQRLRFVGGSYCPCLELSEVSLVISVLVDGANAFGDAITHPCRLCEIKVAKDLAYLSAVCGSLTVTAMNFT